MINIYACLNLKYYTTRIITTITKIQIIQILYKFNVPNIKQL
jgi:hypothetical protein